jgi:hypothetical protein
MTEHLQEFLGRLNTDVKCWYLPEPPLVFGRGYQVADPKAGLGLYGPCGDDDDRPLSRIRVGIIGTGRTIQDAQHWLVRCRSRIVASPESQVDPHLFPAFPGFEARDGFACLLESPQTLVEQLLPGEIAECASLPKALAVEKLTLHVSRRLESLADRETPPDVVLVALPKDVKEIAGERAKSSRRLSPTSSSKPRQLTFFDETREEEEPTGRTLHRAIKGEGMRHGLPTQLIWPWTFEGGSDMEDDATRAWNFCTALYYKAKGMPWRATGLARDTCYVGISFFKPLGAPHLLQTSMAQAFSERGEGVVLRGSSFEWNREQGEPNLSREAAKQLLEDVLAQFERHHLLRPPGRVIVHKSSPFTQEEIAGMEEALRGKVALFDLLSISKGDIRFLRVGIEPPLRGTVLQIAENRYVFYTRGFIPYLGLYPGLRIPRPLDITHAAGTGPATGFLGEVLALTRMNWNSANFAAAEPITLGFSRKVGLILGELPKDIDPAKYFRFYM